MAKAADDMMPNAWTLSHLAAEAQWIIGLRETGVARFLTPAKDGNDRMIEEKFGALVDRQAAMWLASVQIKPPQTILSAGLTPYRRKTKANARRLTRAALNFTTRTR